MEITGAVGKQGFFTAPVDITVDSVFGLAGGFGATADMKKMRVERGNEVLWEGDALRTLIAQGTTLDAMGIQAGDMFWVDAQPVRSTNPAQRAQAYQYLISLPISLFALGKLLGF